MALNPKEAHAAIRDAQHSAADLRRRSTKLWIILGLALGIGALGPMAKTFPVGDREWLRWLPLIALVPLFLAALWLSSRGGAQLRERRARVGGAEVVLIGLCALLTGASGVVMLKWPASWVLVITVLVLAALIGALGAFYERTVMLREGHRDDG